MATNYLWKAGVSFVTIGFITGAFGSHGLRRRSGITPERLHAWETASNYSVFNGLGLMLLSLHPRFATHKFAGPAIMIGGLIFSGTIHGLALWGKERLRLLGPITPLGGTLMIAGYVRQSSREGLD